MPDKLFSLEIITPQRSIFSGSVESFSAPGTNGGFQVLVDHAPFLTTITTGEVKLRDESGRETIYSTSGGFVEVSGNHAFFLADTVEAKDEIDVQRARSAKLRAEGRLKEKVSGTDIDRARASLARAANRLKVAGAS